MFCQLTGMSGAGSAVVRCHIAVKDQNVGCLGIGWPRELNDVLPVSAQPDALVGWSYSW